MSAACLAAPSQKSVPFTVKLEKVFMEQAVDDVIALCQPLVRRLTPLALKGLARIPHFHVVSAGKI